MKIWLIAVAVLGFGACSEPAAQTQGTESPVAQETVPATPPAAEPEPQAPPAEIEILDGSELPKSLEIRGTADTILVWRDGEGRKVLVISNYQKGAFFSEGFRSELWANCHLWHPDGSLEKIWEIKEFNQSIWESPAYINQSLALSDFDGDGVAESCFIYEVAPDGLDPARVKLMLHVRGTKYAIRGQLGVEPESFDEAEVKEFGDNFGQLPKALKDYASARWDDYRNWLQGLINDELSEAEIDRYRPKPFVDPEGY